MTPTITESSGNVFADLGFSDEEAPLLQLRAGLMASLRQVIEARGWTQAHATKMFAIGRPRVSHQFRESLCLRVVKTWRFSTAG